MDENKRYTVEVSSPFEGWWRYNVALMAGCFDGAGNRTGFARSESFIAHAGANLREIPKGINPDHRATLLTEACDHLLLYIYIIPHTLPSDNEIGETQPFDIEVKITCGERLVSRQRIAVNQWSGASIEQRIGRDGVLKEEATPVVPLR